MKQQKIGTTSIKIGIVNIKSPERTPDRKMNRMEDENLIVTNKEDTKMNDPKIWEYLVPDAYEKMGKQISSARLLIPPSG